MLTSSPALLERTERMLSALGLSTQHLQAVERSFLGLATPIYHTPEHMRWVANAFADLASGILSPENLRHGFLAALWHDAHHLQLADDSMNVVAAAKAYRRAVCSGIDDQGLIDIDRVCELILLTENSLDRDLWITDATARYIRDADLLQTVVGPVAERTEWTRRLSIELGDRFVSDGTHESNVAYISERLTTTPARRALELFAH